MESYACSGEGNLFKFKTFIFKDFSFLEIETISSNIDWLSLFSLKQVMYTLKRQVCSYAKLEVLFVIGGSLAAREEIISAELGGNVVEVVVVEK